MILYPRFSDTSAQDVLETLKADVAAGREPSMLSSVGEHRLRETAPIGGHPAESGHILELDRAVRAAVPVSGRPGSRGWGADFDREVSRALLDSLGDALGATEQPGVWSFLSLVVFPDLVLRRFPAKRGVSEERFLDGRRNTFSRLYLRRSIFGDLMDQTDIEILEDDFVGLVDRDYSSDPRLAGALIRRVNNPPRGLDRRAFARELYKEALFEAKVTELRSLEDADLEAAVRDMAERVEARLRAA